ncbi:MAG: hypothetical protein QXO93_00105 [Acidilobaceae archaeon]
MEILFELEPVKSRDSLRYRVSSIAELVDWIDIPDSPMGTSRFSSPIVSCLVKSIAENTRVIAHLRVIDVSRAALESIVGSLTLCGVERILFIRGDIVKGSTIIRDIEPEDAVGTVRSLKLNIDPGLTLSLRKSIDEIMKRLRVGASFYLLLNLTSNNIDVLEYIVREAKTYNSKIYPYIILMTEKNRDKLLRLLGRDKLCEPQEAIRLADTLKSLSLDPDGILLSSPLDFNSGLETLRVLRRIF